MIHPGDLRTALLEWRGIETPCDTCGGSGVRVYGSTSTWRGGMGGCAMTSAVCDKCWGSGDAEHTWCDLRRMMAEHRATVAKEALALLARRAGADSVGGATDAAEEIAVELDRLSKGRKPRVRWFRVLVEDLAKTLREGIAATKEQKS